MDMDMDGSWIISSIDDTSHEASHYIALHFEATSLRQNRTLQSDHKVIQIYWVRNVFETPSNHSRDDFKPTCLYEITLELYEPLISSHPFELPSESNNCVACSKLPHGTAVG